jgi:phosphatidylserine/phosphatidylglycerophosphate/cardiolipin synthase-like enzyme
LKILAILFAGLLISCSSSRQPVKVYFDGDSIENAVIEAINSAHSLILIQAYGFNNENICSALKKAKRKKVKIRLILDQSNENNKNSCMNEMEVLHVPTRIGNEGGIAHNKIMIIDSRFTITGSFNFTENAVKRNQENLLIIDDPEIAERYTSNWFERKVESRKPEKLE